MLTLEDQLSAIIDDADFRQIDKQFSRFNLFEAVGAVRGELRHSNFLAFLLSPGRPHGLGSEILLRVLKAVVQPLPIDERPISTLELVVSDLDGALIYRERDNIDILIELPALKFVVLIENKVDAGAGDGQLKRYKDYLEQRYPAYRRLLIFLTPDGAAPDEPGFVPFSYSELAALIASMLEGDAEVADAPALILNHYVHMLRRHIVPDENLQNLARLLYQRHKEAFDFIFEARPEPESLAEEGLELIRSLPAITEDRHSKTILRFVPKEWCDISTLNLCPSDTWTRTGRNILFEFKMSTGDYERISIALVSGPADKGFRSKIYAAASEDPSIFKGIVRPMGSKYATIFSHELLGSAEAKNLDRERKLELVQERWSQFRDEWLPKLRAAVKQSASNYSNI